MFDIDQASEHVPIEKRFLVNNNHRRAEQSRFQGGRAAGDSGDIRRGKRFARFMMNKAQGVRQGIFSAGDNLLRLFEIAVRRDDDDELNLRMSLRNRGRGIKQRRQNSRELFVTAAGQETYDRLGWIEIVAATKLRAIVSRNDVSREWMPNVLDMRHAAR